MLSRRNEPNALTIGFLPYSAVVALIYLSAQEHLLYLKPASIAVGGSKKAGLEPEDSGNFRKSLISGASRAALSLFQRCLGFFKELDLQLQFGGVNFGAFIEASILNRDCSGEC